MSKIYTSADQMVGNTPILELTHLEKELGLDAKIFASPIQVNSPVNA